tara:strand:- start:1282 stop:1827 length:546 start_codon:yes stop_codon:yes gene_type:complete
MATTWEDFYGYKTGYAGKAKGTNIWEPSGEYGVGFGPGDLRKGFNEGYTATEMLKYLADSNYEQKGIIPQEVKNQMRQSMSIESALSKGFDKYKTLQDNYTKLKGDWDKQKLTINQAAQTAQDALSKARETKHTSPFSVTGGNALTISPASSSAASAGMISAGLAGLSRQGYKLKNQNINV